MPASRKDYFKLMGSDKAKEAFGLKNVVGAGVGPGSAVFPYRLWTGIWSLLLDGYRDRLSIETFTPALKVSEASVVEGTSNRYLVRTPRGEIKTTHVVYCTNAFTSHLLPSLRGKLFPYRGTMSAQDLGSSVANDGDKYAWSFLSTPKEDKQSGVRSASLYYLTQDDSGLMMLGGEYEKPDDLLCSDDSRLNSVSAVKVSEVLPKYFEGAAAPQLKSIWSGVRILTV